MTTKKYTLKPGRHQFAPGSPAVHENENLSDEEAEWYLKQYPHISALFDKTPDADQATDPDTTACRVSAEEMEQPQDIESKKLSDQAGEIFPTSMELTKEIGVIPTYKSV